MNKKNNGSPNHQVAAALARLTRRSRKLLSAVDGLEMTRGLDPARLHHNRILLEHTLRRIELDLAEALQEDAIADCNRLDRELRSLEKSSK